MPELKRLASPAVATLVERLLGHASIGPLVVHHAELPAVAPAFAEPERPLPPALVAAQAGQGIHRLYRHQAQALDLARAGKDVLLVTPTASGKTLAFASTVLETALGDPQARALFLYPTKALAQDQIAGLRNLAAGLGALAAPRFEIYDGDTPAARRKRIKADLPHVLITNPDMLHRGILGHHADWTALLARLRWIVLDELHVYRGVFGAHVHHILARLLRLCALHGSAPRIIAASATVGNPAEFAAALAGRPFEVVDGSGSPCAPRQMLFLNPVARSPYTIAVRVIAEALRVGARTIAFTKSRRATELLYAWLARQEPELAARVAPYRAGYLPEERRRIEARLFGGELLAVLSTSALELGIDVGGLDLCVLVGYPGSLMSAWQRLGRVARHGREGLVVLIALPDALDQYVVRHPELFFGRAFEPAVLDPANPHVAGPHLVCAAAEEPLERREVERFGPDGGAAVAGLLRDGRLVESADGARLYAFRRKPHRDVHPRSAGPGFTILEHGSGKILGTIDATRAYHECHPGAVYLHAGRSFRVRTLDAERRSAVAEPALLDYYTVVLGEKQTEILERLEARALGRLPVGLGRLRVTVHIREYQKKRLFDGEPISTHPIAAPPLTFETVGLWIALPAALPRAFARRELDFMGGIHAAEHAAIGLFPLLAIADRGDVGGISYTGHPQLGSPAIFLYDGVAGGAGLARRGFDDLERHLRRTLELVDGCPCATGCPACIQSPRCGNGNKPLDKDGALLALRVMLGETALEHLGVEAPPPDLDAPLPPYVAPTEPPPGSRRHGIRRAGNVAAELQTLVLDLETRRGVEEVGGWTQTARLGLALAVVYDVRSGAFRTYHEADVDRLLLDLVLADVVVGFNIERFDLAVLSAYTSSDLARKVRTLDLHAEIFRRLGFRLSLAHLSEVNLGEAKSGDGLASLRLWREGRVDLIERYCRKDVDLTRRLWEIGRERGYLLYRDHAERTVRVPVAW